MLGMDFDPFRCVHTAASRLPLIFARRCICQTTFGLSRTAVIRPKRRGLLLGQLSPTRDAPAASFPKSHIVRHKTMWTPLASEGSTCGSGLGLHQRASVGRFPTIGFRAAGRPPHPHRARPNRDDHPDQIASAVHLSSRVPPPADPGVVGTRGVAVVDPDVSHVAPPR